jgi:hypothetical protein
MLSSGGSHNHGYIFGTLSRHVRNTERTQPYLCGIIRRTYAVNFLVPAYTRDIDRIILASDESYSN